MARSRRLTAQPSDVVAMIVCDGGFDDSNQRTVEHAGSAPRFAIATEAIRYAVEELRARRSLSAWMQIEEDRYNSDEIHRLRRPRDRT